MVFGHRETLGGVINANRYCWGYSNRRLIRNNPFSRNSHDCSININGISAETNTQQLHPFQTPPFPSDVNG